MTVPVFFVQNNYVEHLTGLLAVYARSRGIALEDRSVVQGFDPDDCGIDWSEYDLVLPYGSVQFVRALKTSSLSCFVLHDESRFATSAWVAEFGSDALNGAGRFAVANDVSELLRYGTYHLRPDKIDKAFAGGVFDLEKWEMVRLERKLANDLACWVSPLQSIDSEWRCWVVGGQVVEISQYRDGGQMALKREVSPEVRDVAQGFANLYLPSPCVVLDLALGRDGYKLIEFNPIHSSGWYKADVDVVLDAWLAWAITHMFIRQSV